MDKDPITGARKLLLIYYRSQISKLWQMKNNTIDEIAPVVKKTATIKKPP